MLAWWVSPEQAAIVGKAGQRRRPQSRMYLNLKSEIMFIYFNAVGGEGQFTRAGLPTQKNYISKS